MEESRSGAGEKGEEQEKIHSSMKTIRSRNKKALNDLGTVFIIIQQFFLFKPISRDQIFSI